MDETEIKPNRVGIAVDCTTCGQRKKPRGRSAPLGAYLCDMDCQGYFEEPQSGSLWPGETSEEFGYPVGQIGTAETEQQ